jgi:hypothetical protein
LPTKQPPARRHKNRAAGAFFFWTPMLSVSFLAARLLDVLLESARRPERF